MPTFLEHSDCTLCPLHLDCKSVGIRTDMLWTNCKGHGTALLVVGEKPGWRENETGEVWVGEVGDVLRKVYIRFIAAKVKTPLTIYGTNAVRCMPPQGDSPTETQVRKCTPHLLEDLKAIAQEHEDIVVLGAGAFGCKALGFKSLGTGVKKQGEVLHFDEVGHVRFFATHNPGAMLPGRDPSCADPTQDHLELLCEFLNTGTFTMTGSIAANHHNIGRLPDEAGDIVAIDIETYGAVEGYPKQTVFCPARAEKVDKCPPAQMIVTAAAAWRTPEGVETAYWVFPEQQDQFWAFMRNAVRRGKHFLGQNLPFDMQFLRYVERLRPGTPCLTQPAMRESGSMLLELGMANYHDCDARMEKSLKQIAVLLRAASYSEDVDLSKGQRYPDKWCAQLEHYNCKDVMATLLAWERFHDRILRKYPGTWRMSPTSLAWYNDMIWLVIHMDEAGIVYDVNKLLLLHRREKRKQERLLSWGARSGYMLAGKGSKKWKEDTFLEGVQEAGLAGDSRLETTKKTRSLSTSQANRNLILDSLPLGHGIRGALRMLGAFLGSQKLTSSYTSKLLYDPQVGCVNGHAYPSWYVAPGNINDDQGAGGGTKQSRLTCKNPAKQTEPPPVKKCQMSRFPGGVVIDSDSSQIERRKMALWSGDPAMMQEYLDDLDCHLNAGMIFLEELGNLMSMRGLDNAFGFNRGWIDDAVVLHRAQALTKEHPGIKPVRQFGKVSNFLMGFRGGAATLQGAARKMCRMELPLDFCRTVIEKGKRKYHGLWLWQESIIEEACSKGYLEIPFCGDARLFRGGRSLVRASYTTHICNILIQGSAACTIKSAQAEINQELQELEARSVITWNGYDALYPDCPPEEESLMIGLLDKWMDNPPYYQRLQEYLGRTLPLAHETKVLSRRTTI